MKEYIQRMIKEKEDLDNKIHMLNNYLINGPTKDITEIKFTLMSAQLSTMKTYSYLIYMRSTEEGIDITPTTSQFPQ